jgi:hypothetical protein
VYSKYVKKLSITSVTILFEMEQFSMLSVPSYIFVCFVNENFLNV